MLELLGRGALFILAMVIFFLAKRLHTKASGKAAKVQKTIATIAALLAGLALIGTFVGGWMGEVTGASPYIAAAIFLITAGGLCIDWWTDGVPDRFAFWCALFLPLAIVFGFSQLSNVGDVISRNAEQVSNTISSQGR